jgi:membrane associated rhomboid family serine protease
VTRNPYPGGRMGGFNLAGPVPRDVLIILGVLFVTFALRFFQSTAIVPAVLELTPLVWTRGWVWQLVTYPFIGVGGLLFLIDLLILYLFARDVYYGMYRKHFWRLILWSSTGAALVAVAVHVLLTFAGLHWAPAPFAIMQGQWILLAIFIAAFATAQRDATIYLMFILPIPAFWMLWVEILFAFLAFLFTKDLPGFLGICSAVGLSYLYVRSSGSLRGGRKSLREMRLRLEKWWIQRKLDRARRKRGFKVIPGDKGPNVRKGPWVN